MLRKTWRVVLGLQTHPELNCFVIHHVDLQVDRGLGPRLGGEADVEGVLAQVVAGQALVGSVVAVEDGLDSEGGLPGAVANLRAGNQSVK